MGPCERGHSDGGSHAARWARRLCLHDHRLSPLPRQRCIERGEASCTTSLITGTIHIACRCAPCPSSMSRAPGTRRMMVGELLAPPRPPRCFVFQWPPPVELAPRPRRPRRSVGDPRALRPLVIGGAVLHHLLAPRAGGGAAGHPGHQGPTRWARHTAQRAASGRGLLAAVALFRRWAPPPASWTAPLTWRRPVGEWPRFTSPTC